MTVSRRCRHKTATSLLIHKNFEDAATWFCWCSPRQHTPWPHRGRERASITALRGGDRTRLRALSGIQAALWRLYQSRSLSAKFPRRCGRPGMRWALCCCVRGRHELRLAGSQHSTGARKQGESTADACVVAREVLSSISAHCLGMGCSEDGTQQRHSGSEGPVAVETHWPSPDSLCKKNQLTHSRASRCDDLAPPRHLPHTRVDSS